VFEVSEPKPVGKKNNRRMLGASSTKEYTLTVKQVEEDQEGTIQFYPTSQRFARIFQPAYEFDFSVMA
jgi:hypothetical protein